MKKFQYQIVRYIHDRTTEEFVNVGIILFQPDDNYLNCKFVNKFNRISHFFSDVKSNYFLNLLKHYKSEIDILSKKINGLFQYPKFLADLTEQILHKDDSSLVNTEVLYIYDNDSSNILDVLFDRLVNKYNENREEIQFDDSYAWRKIYKQYFQKYDIIRNLQKYDVKTKNDIIKFDKAWKNGVWNCYQSLSFEIKKEESIKNKVYKWSGILNEIKTSDSKLKIYFLTYGIDNENNEKIKFFIEDTLQNQGNDNIKIKLIKEKDANNFAKSVKEEIENH